MRDAQWRPGAGLIAQLLAEPQRFEFFQAVRLLEMTLPGGADWLRYRNRLSLAFPISQVDAIARTEGQAAVTPAFMGLLGVSGALPHHYTERIAAHEQRTGDDGPRAFLDMLSTRSLAMFYEAWAMHRTECMLDRDGGDGFLAMLLALAGARPDGRHLVDSATVARYAASVRSRSVSAAVLGGVLSEYFGIPMQVEQLVGIWEELPSQHQAQLGCGNCSLADGVLLGERQYRCDTRARIRIGPLDKAGFERFLPHRAGAAALQAMLAMHCTVGIAFEVRLLLRAEDAHGFSLRRSEADGGARLGVNAFLLAAPSPRDRDDASYLLQS
jgi:type VI secretion system protein ImpH